MLIPMRVTLGRCGYGISDMFPDCGGICPAHLIGVLLDEWVKGDLHGAEQAAGSLDRRWGMDIEEVV